MWYKLCIALTGDGGALRWPEAVGPELAGLLLGGGGAALPNTVHSPPLHGPFTAFDRGFALPPLQRRQVEASDASGWHGVLMREHFGPG